MLLFVYMLVEYVTAKTKTAWVHFMFVLFNFPDESRHLLEDLLRLKKDRAVTAGTVRYHLARRHNVAKRLLTSLCCFQKRLWMLKTLLMLFNQLVFVLRRFITKIISRHFRKGAGLDDSHCCGLL